MNLHNNKDLFFEIITRTSEQFGIDKTIVEKDYYVSLLLNSYINDYNQITKLMLFKDVSYDEVILSLKDILNSKIF